MKKIAVVTATRAEYGLLSPVIKELRSLENKDFRTDIIVTGTHLSNIYGATVHEIERDGMRIDHIVPISINSETELDISKNQADALIKFTELFMAEKYNGVLLLGDRYETLAIAIAAGNTRTPVFHMCGGDVTEGAIDEWIRHSITKVSYLHFTTNEESRRRVIQLGEDPSRVYNFGSTSIDNILKAADMSKEEALKSIGLPMCNYALCTYHPVTLENKTVDKQIQSFLSAIQHYQNLHFIVTKSNADQGGARINTLLDEATTSIRNLHVYASLGVRRYLSLMKYSEFVLGNSSSGIVETPSFKIPTINIGNRQRGRLQTQSIINCGEDTDEIIAAIKMAESDKMKELCRKVTSPYGNGNAAKLIAQKITEIVQKGRIDLKKSFYDL